MPDVFDTTADWLLDQTLQNVPLTETLKNMAHRLIDGGVPISRLVLGRSTFHPLIAVTDHRWDATTDEIDTFSLTRDAFFKLDLSASPFGTFRSNEQSPQDGLQITEIRGDLKDPEKASEFEIFGTLAAAGHTDYAAWTVPFSAEWSDFAQKTGLVPGASVAFCTTRRAGFTEAEIAGLKQLVRPAVLCVRLASDTALTQALLETYLGRNTGRRVLTGESGRGDGDTIDCILFYSDMRGFSTLSAELPQDDYLALLNRYFDCTAGAVLDHGGEVLKLVGDAVLAIFPIDGSTRPAEAMANAALAAAQDAFARAADLADPPHFGIALHRGEVVYGNVGLPKRLDYTATGAAVAQVCRCETLTKTLETPIAATPDFAALCATQGTPGGAHDLRGFAGTQDIMCYPIIG